MWDYTVPKPSKSCLAIVDFVDRSGAENSPLDYVKQLSADDRQKLHVYLDAGSGDGKYLVESREFHQELEALRVQNVFNEFLRGYGVSGAGAGWHYWHHHLEDSLGFVGDRFRDTDLMERVTAQRQNLTQTSNGVSKNAPGKIGRILEFGGFNSNLLYHQRNCK